MGVFSYEKACGRGGGRRRGGAGRGGGGEDNEVQARPEPDAPTTPDRVRIDGQKAVDDLAAMIRCRTVSNRNHSAENEGEFERFRGLLRERVPGGTRELQLAARGALRALVPLEGHRGRAGHGADGALRRGARGGERLDPPAIRRRGGGRGCSYGRGRWTPR